MFSAIPATQLSSAFGLTASKAWYNQYFNTEGNLNSVGSIPVVSYYGVDAMNVGERTESLEWYDKQWTVLFDNKRVLESFSKDDITVVRQACQVFIASTASHEFGWLL